MYCFTKARRLLTKQDYNYVFEQAKKIVTSDLTLLYRKNDLGHARLGLAISKKIVAKSHDRNQIKRLLRETFRLRNDLPAVDIIVLARPGVREASRALLIENLGRTWDKLANQK